MIYYTMIDSIMELQVKIMLYYNFYLPAYILNSSNINDA